jgi:hypothetical protein
MHKWKGVSTVPGKFMEGKASAKKGVHGGRPEIEM